MEGRGGEGESIGVCSHRCSEFYHPGKKFGRIPFPLPKSIMCSEIHFPLLFTIVFTRHKKVPAVVV